MLISLLVNQRHKRKKRLSHDQTFLEKNRSDFFLYIEITFYYIKNATRQHFFKIMFGKNFHPQFVSGVLKFLRPNFFEPNNAFAISFFSLQP